MSEGTPAIGKLWAPYPRMGPPFSRPYYILDMREEGNLTVFDLVHLGDRRAVVWGHKVGRIADLDVAFEDATDEQVAHAMRILLTQ